MADDAAWDKDVPGERERETLLVTMIRQWRGSSSVLKRWWPAVSLPGHDRLPPQSSCFCCEPRIQRLIISTWPQEPLKQVNSSWRLKSFEPSDSIWMALQVNRTRLDITFWQRN